MSEKKRARRVGCKTTPRVPAAGVKAIGSRAAKTTLQVDDDRRGVGWNEKFCYGVSSWAQLEGGIVQQAGATPGLRFANTTLLRITCSKRGPQNGLLSDQDRQSLRIHSLRPRSAERSIEEGSARKKISRQIAKTAATTTTTSRDSASAASVNWHDTTARNTRNASKQIQVCSIHKHERMRL